MIKFNKRNTVITFVTASICGTFGYICGHATCAHQHVPYAEQQKMLCCDPKTGKLQYGKYIINAFLDYKRMKDDPLGLHKEAH